MRGCSRTIKTNIKRTETKGKTTETKKRGMILMMEKDFKVQDDATREFFNNLRNSDLFKDKKNLGGLNMDDDFFKGMIEKDILSRLESRLDGTNIKNLNNTIKEMTLDVNTKTFIAGISRIFLLRSAALNELDTVSLLNPVSDKHDLSLEDVENVIPYLEVIEKCSNIIEKYHAEKRREEK